MESRTSSALKKVRIGDNAGKKSQLCTLRRAERKGRKKTEGCDAPRLKMPARTDSLLLLLGQVSDRNIRSFSSHHDSSGSTDSLREESKM